MVSSLTLGAPAVARTLAVTKAASCSKWVSSHPKRTVTFGNASRKERRSGSSVYCEMS